MSILIIANKQSSVTTSRIINEAWVQYISKDGRKGKSSGKSTISVISNLEDFRKYEFSKLKPEYIFIQVELGWTNTGNKYEGYDIAIELFLQKFNGHSFFLQFISLSNRAILFGDIGETHRKLVETFEHYQLPLDSQQISFTKYSQIHFELIKSLVISREGRLNYIDHELDKVKNNIENLSPSNDYSNTKEFIKHQLEEIALLEVLIKDRIIEIKSKLSRSNELSVLKRSIVETRNIIEEIKSSDSFSLLREADTKNKSNYKILIIEDEPDYREFFCNTFSSLFTTVYPSNIKEIKEFEIKTADKLIAESASDYDIIILDLLYKDKNGFWLNFNGLDLFTLAKSKNPYACIRIITSLPRDIVAKIVEQILKFRIDISHIFTKRVGFEALKYGIHDRVLGMNMECQEMEKKKSIFKPIPTEGVFKWPSVPGIMLNLMTKRIELFEEIVQKSESLFQLFIKSELSTNTEGWNKGELPSPKMKESISESFLIQKLPSILTHRLLVINFALRNSLNVVDAEEYEGMVLNKHICNISTIDKGYLHTKLGFHATPFTNDDYSGFKIEFRNFFPHEILYIAENAITSKKPETLNDYPELKKWFISILLDLDTYENIEELNLSFRPYNNIAAIEEEGLISESYITVNLTLVNLIDFLNSLTKSFLNPYVIKIKDIAESNFNINEAKAIIPLAVKRYIDQMFDL